MNDVGCEVLASIAMYAANANQLTIAAAIAAAGAIPVILTAMTAHTGHESTAMTVQTLITHTLSTVSRQKHSLKLRAQKTALRAQETAAKRSHALKLRAQENALRAEETAAKQSRYLKAYEYAGKLARKEIDVMDNNGKIKKSSYATIAKYAINRFALQFSDGTREQLISKTTVSAAKTSSHPPQSRGPTSRKRPLSDVDDDGMHVDTSTLEEGGLQAPQVEARLLADQMMQDVAASATEDDDASAAEDSEASSADERPDPETVEQPVEFSR